MIRPTRVLLPALALVAVLHEGAAASRVPRRAEVVREARREVAPRPGKARPSRLSLAGARARITRSTAFRAVSGKLPTPRSRVRALALGVVEGPWHTIEHLANKKALAIAVGSTATLGVLIHVAGIPTAVVATPVLIGVLAHRWWKGARALRAAPPGPERARIVGRQFAATAEIAAELAGVHALHPHGAEGVAEAATTFGARLADLGSAALQGVIGFHELFYIDLRSRKGDDHGHGHGH